MHRAVDLIGVPSEVGGQNGTASGPDVLGPPLLRALSEAGLAAAYHHVRGLQDFPSPSDVSRKPRGKVYYQKRVAAVADLVADCTFTSLCREHLPVVLGGDHSIAIGSQRSACNPDLLKGRTVGLVWIDAHYDAHTEETTRSHNANGMPLATLLGFGPRAFLPSRWEADGKKLRRQPCQVFRPEHVLHLGVGETDCEPEEKALLDRLGVRIFAARGLHKNFWTAGAALKALLERVDLVSVSLDLDAIDRTFAPAVHLQSDGGITRTMLLCLADEVAMSKKLWSVDIMEYKQSAEEYNENGEGRTVALARDFLLRLLGR